MTVLNLLRGAVPLTRYPYTGQKVACNICASTETRELSAYDRRLKRLRTVMCMGCGLHRTDPMPTDQELSEYYRSSYRLDYQMAGSKPPKFHLKRSAANARERFNFLKKAMPQGARVLDLGCGTGEFLKECKDHGHNATGIEPGEVYASHAHQSHGVEIFNTDWDRVDLGARKFDVIVSFHVFEHLRDPKSALKWVVDRLAPGGIVLLEVPDMSPLENGPRLYERLHFAHVHGFTPKTLQLLAASCGLELHPDVAATGIRQVFRRAADPARLPAPDPAYAAQLIEQYDGTNPVADALKGRWIADSARRIGRDIRETFN